MGNLVASRQYETPVEDLTVSDRTDTANDRQISLGPGLSAIPERLLLAHARGEVLFIVGAGVSHQADLPLFPGLVLKVYERLDMAVYDALARPTREKAERSNTPPSDLSPQQRAEIKRFEDGDYDVVLGMLERRMDLQTHKGSSVREAIAEELRSHSARPAPIHRALMRLAVRGQASRL